MPKQSGAAVSVSCACSFLLASIKAVNWSNSKNSNVEAARASQISLGTTAYWDAKTLQHILAMQNTADL